ncbi:hypothetical protein GR157_04215 [Burkholderia sp. 4701]|nr:hypothetical protein [Burkholderia sp. 4701]MXN81055.1 hypothetical protein [Burkholderia sp. 4812]
MKRDTVVRFLGAARAGHDALSSAQVLSGSPVMTRSERCVAGADPLRIALAQARWPHWTPMPRGESSSSHGSPERERFHLPTFPPQAACPEEGEVDEC